MLSINEGTNIHPETCLLGEKPRKRVVESREEITVDCIYKGVDYYWSEKESLVDSESAGIS